MPPQYNSPLTRRRSRHIRAAQNTDVLIKPNSCSITRAPFAFIYTRELYPTARLPIYYHCAIIIVMCARVSPRESRVYT